MNNKVWTVRIDGLANGGDGVGRAPDGRALFVSGAAPGDLLDVRVTEEHKTYARGVLAQLKEAGPDRVQPPCPAFIAGCGGCSWQQLSAPAQNTAKVKFLRDALQRIGGFADAPVDGVLAPADGYHYRNKAQVPIALAPDGSLRLGYYREGTHDVVPLPEEGCRLLAPAADAALRFVRGKLGALGLHPYDQRRGSGTLRHVMVRSSTRGEAMVVLVTREALPADATAVAAKWLGQAGIASVQNNIQAKTGNVVMGDETRVLAGPAALDEDLDGLRFQLSATSFFQVNPAQTLALLDVLKGIRAWKQDETVLELYCGIGTLSLPLAKLGVRVHGVEIHAAAVEDARAAAITNGLKSASFSVGGAAQGWMGLPQGFVPQVLLVDPPRKGLDPAVLESLKRQPVPELVYVSCDPASLARDLKALAAQGYQLLRCQGVDLFPQTAHVESVSHLTRV
jgi:23S rRNA (uracil1939-C5)-methyltransferase